MICDVVMVGYELVQCFYDVGNVNELQLWCEQGFVEFVEVELFVVQ